MKTAFILMATAFVVTLQSQPVAADFLFEYELPIRKQFSTRKTFKFTKCRVTSLIDEGVRYYQTYLEAPEIPQYLTASARVTRGTLTADSFAYEDTLPDVIDGQLVELTYSTEYELDPKTHQTIRTELRVTDPSGKVIEQYVCVTPDLMS